MARRGGCADRTGLGYYHTDALGSVRAVTKVVNGQVQVVSGHDYMPFGEEVNPPSPPTEKRLFTGQERDFETGLDYFNARQLAAAFGRFTTTDPGNASASVYDSQSWNLYAHARNNPLKYVDPSGLDEVPGISDPEPAVLVGERFDPWNLPEPFDRGESSGLTLYEEDRIAAAVAQAQGLVFVGRQPDGSYQANLQWLKDDITNLMVNGKPVAYFGESHWCVALVKNFAKLPDSPQWSQGQQVWGNNLPPGTAIATFDQNGRYPSEIGWNSAILIRYTSNGIWIYDQWLGHPATPDGRFIGLTGGRPNNATAYSVIVVK